MLYLVNSVTINIASQIGETIKQDIAVKAEKREINKKRKKKLKQGKAHDTIQKEQQKIATLVEKREEFEAVRKRIREQYMEKQV